MRYSRLRCLYIFLIFIVLLGSWHLTASAEHVISDLQLAKLIRSTLGLANDAHITKEDLVLCQSLIEGYSFLSLIRASSVVNRQWTVVPC